MRITVCYSPRPRALDRVELDLPDNTTVRQALLASGLLERYAELALPPMEQLSIAVWGERVVSVHAPLRDRDRVELLRPLRVDPKEARRQRAR